MYCCTFKSTSYGYWHYNGSLSIKEKETCELNGTLRLLLDTQNRTSGNKTTSDIRQAVIWLKRNNHLYSEILPNCELISNYTTSSINLENGTWNGLPILTNTNIMHVVNAANIDLSTDGLLLKANEYSNEQNPGTTYLGENAIKDKQ
jgi:hypothetical protein